MTTEQLISIDCTEQRNMAIIQKALRKIKPFENYNMGSDVPLDKLEKMLRLMANKYMIEVSWIFVLHDDHNTQYTIHIFEPNYKENKTYGSIHGITLYELVAKTVIYVWTLAKRRVIKERKKVK